MKLKKIRRKTNIFHSTQNLYAIEIVLAKFLKFLAAILKQAFDSFENKLFVLHFYCGCMNALNVWKSTNNWRDFNAISVCVQANYHVLYWYWYRYSFMFEFVSAQPHSMCTVSRRRLFERDTCNRYWAYKPCARAGQQTTVYRTVNMFECQHVYLF